MTDTQFPPAPPAFSHSPPARPVNRDTLIAGLTAGFRIRESISEKLLATTLREEMIDLVGEAEWFDFGEIDEKRLGDTWNDAMPFAKAGLVALPFPICVFRFRLKTAKGALDVLLLCADVDVDRPLLATATGATISVSTFFVGSTMVPYLSDFFTLCGTHVHSLDPKDKAAGSAAHAFLFLWLVLNTKNLDHRVFEPPDKLNKARAKNHKSPLRRVTYIDSSKYGRALDETRAMERVPGTHASPRMHLRRAHLRHLKDGRILSIHATIVNAHMDPVVRAKYLVRTGEAAS